MTISDPSGTGTDTSGFWGGLFESAASAFGASTAADTQAAQLKLQQKTLLGQQTISANTTKAIIIGGLVLAAVIVVVVIFKRK